jgi:hypothetical protein
MSAEQHIHITYRYVEPVNYGVAMDECWDGSVDEAQHRAEQVMADDANVYEAVVSVSYIDRVRENRMTARDRALGLIPADGAS